MSYLCGMKKITIKKGNHLSYSQPISIPCILPKDAMYLFSFTEESKYILNNEDQQDWNKLVGFSSGLLPTNFTRPAHYNSLRVGWSYDPIKDSFLVTPYWYENGLRGYLKPEHALELKSNEEFFVDFYQPSPNVLALKIESCRTGHAEEAQININSKFGYILPPYFGGNNPAPNDVSFFYNFY